VTRHVFLRWALEQRGTRRKGLPVAVPTVGLAAIGPRARRPGLGVALTAWLARAAAAAAAAVAALAAPVPEVVHDDDRRLRYGDLVLDLDTRDVWRGAHAIVLTKMEFNLLELFLRHPHQVLTREVIFDRVWGFGYALSSNTLNVYVGYLRRKTESGGAPRIIHTVRGVGYVLRAHPPPGHALRRA
jgi:DNA-binding response OmpR family regulator